MKENIEHIFFKDINSSMLSYIKKENPSYIFNASGFILRNDLILIPQCGVLNFHCAPLPEYRGAANYFWMILDDIEYAYGTLHYVDRGLDTGEIISFSNKVSIHEASSVFDLWFKIRTEAYNTFEPFIDYLKAGVMIPSFPQESKHAKVHSFPSKQDLKVLHYPVFTFSDILKIVVFSLKQE